MTQPTDQLQALLNRGVRLPHPPSVYIDADVNPERIHPSVTLHPGTRLHGRLLSIGPESEIGAENPATVKNCQLGASVSLKGGYYEGSVFLDRSSVGSAAHVRAGCLLEEEACAAHAVGLKQTILFPFVTLGSLINFCDIWMAGGTSRKNHSEVGSSFIHFNFTPHGDKATPSLIGDVPRGILLNQPPIFLGGQGGLVGPVSTGYGVVQAAGSICRRDLTEDSRLYQSAVPKERYQPYTMGQVRDPESKWAKNLTYLASLNALRGWYRHFRMPVMAGDVFTTACLQGAEGLLQAAVAERLKQLKKWIGLLQEDSWQQRFERLQSLLEQDADGSALDGVVRELPSGADYVETVRALTGPQQAQIRTYFAMEIQRCGQATEAV